MLSIFVLFACNEPAPAATGPDSEPTDADTDTDTDTDSDTDTDADSDADADSDTDTDADTDTTADTGTPIPTTGFDCANLPAIPAPYTTLNWVPAAEDFTFDADGHYLAVTGGHLQSVDYGGGNTILVPNLGDVRGTRLLPDGRAALAHIESGSVLLVDPDTGSQEVLASGLQNPNGIAIDMDGNVFVTTTGAIMKLDPVAHTVEPFAEIANHSFDGLTFSPAYDRLYFNEEFGRVHWVDIDASGVPGPVQTGPSIPIGPFSLLDGMAADVCGTIYGAELGARVWRVRTDGTIEVVVDIGGVAIIPALNFGTGVSGWDADTLYVQDFLGKMHAVELGIPGKVEPHW